MERLISDEERIRRAEDVLERRRNLDYGPSNDSTDKNHNNKMVKKMFIQALVCLCIYCGVYYIKNTGNENFNSMVATIKDTLNYDVNFKQIYDNLCAEIQKININSTETNVNNINTDSDGNELIEDKDGKSETENDIQDDGVQKNNEGVDSDKSVSSEENEMLGIGGAFDENNTSEPLNYELQMQIDADYIKHKLNMMNPLEIGVITSGFGSREASNVVSGNHKGIDLGASTGSIIVAAADGNVVEASSQGDFGIHLKIQNDDVTTIYGHCSELLVNEGDIVCKGQEIAKVGATRKGYWTTFAF